MPDLLSTSPIYPVLRYVWSNIDIRFCYVHIPKATRQVRLLISRSAFFGCFVAISICDLKIAICFKNVPNLVSYINVAYC